MKRIVVPTRDLLDWKRLLAQPNRHWKPGYSAMALAQCWEAASPGFPIEVLHAFKASGAPELGDIELLLAVPEYKVQLEGGARPSQTDLLVLTRGPSGLVCVGVEGKVSEDFGPTLGAKRKESDGGVPKRLTQLHRVLELATPLPDRVRYQLLHRTASAVLAAQQFSAATAVMLVHSFSPHDAHFEDFEDFAKYLGVTAAIGAVHPVQRAAPPHLLIGWCRGPERFLSVVAQGVA